VLEVYLDEWGAEVDGIVADWMALLASAEAGCQVRVAMPCTADACSAAAAARVRSKSRREQGQGDEGRATVFRAGGRVLSVRADLAATDE
jgi:hypothetical protein